MNERDRTVQFLGNNPGFERSRLLDQKIVMSLTDKEKQTILWIRDKNRTNAIRKIAEIRSKHD